MRVRSDRKYEWYQSLRDKCLFSLTRILRSFIFVNVKYSMQKSFLIYHDVFELKVIDELCEDIEKSLVNSFKK